MLITKVSMLTNKVRTMDLDVTEEQMAKWNEGKTLVQRVFPHLTADEREFILSGITPEEWTEAFAEPDETEPYEDEFYDPEEAH